MSRPVQHRLDHLHHRLRTVSRETLHEEGRNHVATRFAQQLYRAHETRGVGASNKDAARMNIEEAQTFVEAAYAAYQRLLQQRNATQAAE